MKVRALEKTYYDRRDRMPGDIYDMDDREEAQAKLLAILGKIEFVQAAPGSLLDAPKQTAYVTAHVTQEAEPEAEPEKPNINPATGKRFYRRRDMRPEK